MLWEVSVYSFGILLFFNLDEETYYEISQVEDSTQSL